MTYYLDRNPRIQYLQDLLSEKGRERMIQAGRSITWEGEIRPRMAVPVFAMSRSGTLQVYPMVWGMTFPGVPGKTAPVFMTETPTDLPAERMRKYWDFSRCAVPASWAYEPEAKVNNVTGKTEEGQERYLIQPAGMVNFYICGIFHSEDGLPTFSLLSRPSGLDICSRTPAVIQGEYVKEWCAQDGSPDHVIRRLLVTDFIYERES